MLDTALRRVHDLEVAHRLLSGRTGNEAWMTLPEGPSQELGTLIADSPAPERDFFAEHLEHLQDRHVEMQKLLPD